MGDRCQRAATVLLAPVTASLGSGGHHPSALHLTSLGALHSPHCLGNIIGASGKVAKHLWLQVGGTCVHLG